MDRRYRQFKRTEKYTENQTNKFLHTEKGQTGKKESLHFATKNIFKIYKHDI